MEVDPDFKFDPDLI